MAESYDDNLLLGYVEGTLEEFSRARVEGWMSQDPHLADLLRRLAQDRAAVRGLPEAAPPPAIMEVIQKSLEVQGIPGAGSLYRAAPPAVVQEHRTFRSLVIGGALAALLLVVAALLMNSLTGVERPDTAVALGTVQTRRPSQAARPSASSGQVSAKRPAAKGGEASLVETLAEGTVPGVSGKSGTDEASSLPSAPELPGKATDRAAAPGPTPIESEGAIQQLLKEFENQASADLLSRPDQTPAQPTTPVPVARLRQAPGAAQAPAPLQSQVPGEVHSEILSDVTAFAAQKPLDEGSPTGQSAKAKRAPAQKPASPFLAEQDVVEAARQIAQNPEVASGLELQIVSRKAQATVALLSELNAGPKAQAAPGQAQVQAQVAQKAVRAIGQSTTQIRQNLEIHPDRLVELVQSLKDQPDHISVRFQPRARLAAGRVPGPRLESEASQLWPAQKPDYAKVLRQQLPLERVQVRVVVEQAQGE